MLRRVLLSCVFASALLGDGGIVELQTPVPPFVLTVFRDESSLGTDLSVLLQDAATLTPVLDAAVSFDSEGQQIPALLGKGQNKLLYSAHISLRAADWPYRVQVDRGAIHVSARGILARPPKTSETSRLLYVLVVPIGILLFLLRGYLVRVKLASVGGRL